jgi:hypothetical protein
MGGDRRLAGAALVVIVSALTATSAGAQRPTSPIGPRDFRPEPRGAATLRGRVTVDGTSTPVRGAAVRAIPRSAGEVLNGTTNEEGWFEFAGLAPGRWTLEVDKGGFLQGRLGQRTPTGPGITATLGAAETLSVAVPLIKGAVIAGQILDDVGEPVAAARVEAMRWTGRDGQRALTAVGQDQTDDTGAYRIHSLPPGDYLVLARGGSGMDQRMVHVDANGSAGMFHLVLDAAPGRARAAAPTYFPGTTATGDAQRVTLRRGEERVGISFALTNAPLVRVSGTIVSSSGAPLQGQVTVSLLDADAPGSGPMTMGSRRTDGNFDLRDVAPGPYLLVAAHGAFPAPQAEFAMMPIVVGTEDITGLTLVTRPGGSVKGTVTGDGDVTPNTSDMGVFARPLRRGAFPLVDIGAPVRDGRFEIANIATASRLQIDRMPPGWTLKSITVGGVDVTDTPLEFASGTQLTASIVLTNRITRLAGVATVAGKPAEHATVVVFPADESKWAAPSRYVGVGRADEAGNYSITALPPLESYLAAAVDEFESTMEQDREFLERLRAVATPVSLAEGESKQLNLAVDR